ncbi:MAG: DUF1501 domain-containing protein [Cyanobacteria bacterium SZAS TMP-1]|nr:DUF1501 domain-containing protein [Cyanobacteria bacterium SZAS TMP-1]
MKITRRKLLIEAARAGTICLSAGEFLKLAALAADRVSATAPRALVVIWLSGGNDGLNMVVPYTDSAYLAARPAIAIKAGEVLKLNDKVGFNPAMTGLSRMFSEGHVAVCQAVGYPHANRSHFHSRDIWETGNPDGFVSSGWLGRALDSLDSQARSRQVASILPAVNLDPVLPKSLVSHHIAVPTVNNLADFDFRTDPKFAGDRNTQLAALNDIYQNFSLGRPHVELLREAGLAANKASDKLLKIVHGYKAAANYPGGGLGDALRFVSQMICGGVNARVYNLSLGGFDTHINQKPGQANQLRQLSDAVAAFHNDLAAHHLDKSVITLIYSEFGRRVAENGSQGTDHGAAAPVIVVGKSVSGGVYGEHASLTNLDEGDLKYAIDYRQIYASILERWFGLDAHEILGKNFEQIALVEKYKT